MIIPSVFHAMAMEDDLVFFDNFNNELQKLSGSLALEITLGFKIGMDPLEM